MCKWVTSGANRIDPCMREFIKQLKIGGAKTLACCCGHGVYAPTVVFEKKEGIVAVAYCKNKNAKAVLIPRKKRFYRRDSSGVYFIPELSGQTTGKV